MDKHLALEACCFTWLIESAILMLLCLYHLTLFGCKPGYRKVRMLYGLILVIAVDTLIFAVSGIQLFGVFTPARTDDSNLVRIMRGFGLFSLWYSIYLMTLSIVSTYY